MFLLTYVFLPAVLLTVAGVNLFTAKRCRRPRIVLLKGDTGVGKDTAAEYMAARYGYSHLSFAAALKDMAVDMLENVYHLREDPEELRRLVDEPRLKDMVLGTRHSETRGDGGSPSMNGTTILSPKTGGVPHLLKNELMTGRDLVRYIGMLNRRILGDDVWANVVKRRIQGIMDVAATMHVRPRIVVSDLRFFNELFVLEEAFPWATVEVWEIERGPVKKREHASEVEWPQIRKDRVLRNEGSKQELYAQVRACLRGR